MTKMNEINFRKALFILMSFAFLYIDVLFSLLIFIPYVNYCFFQLISALLQVSGRYNKRKIFISIPLIIISVTMHFYLRGQFSYYAYNNEIIHGNYDMILWFSSIFIIYTIDGVLSFYPTAFESMNTKRAFFAILPDAISYGFLLFLGLLFRNSTLYLLTEFYVIIRLWSMLFGIYSPTFNINNVIWNTLSYYGRFGFAALLVAFLFLNRVHYYPIFDYFPYLGTYIMFLPLILIIARLLKYVQLILPGTLHSLFSYLYIVPGVFVFIPISLLISLPRIILFSGGDLTIDSIGESDLNIESDSIDSTVDFNADGIVDGYDMNDDGFVDTNIWGYSLGPLQNVSSYIKK